MASRNTAIHSLMFLDPGHFHAALTLRVPQPRAADEVFVYAREGAELRDFLALVERFNRRSPNPTRWRPVVTTADDPLGRLVEERRGDVVILAGRNGGKARTIRRLHESGFLVLADKPWLVEPGDLEHVRASLDGWPLAAEIMTGRHDVAAGLVKRLVGAAEIFGAFRDDGPAIEQESVHHLEKLVDGAPLRRPWWFFDVRAQGSGPVDIPTRVVDARARGGVPADHRRGRVPAGARAVRRRRHAELSMQRRARVSDRSRDRERRDAVEPLAVAGWRRCLSQCRSRDSRGRAPRAERPHGPPPQSLPRAPHPCR